MNSKASLNAVVIMMLLSIKMNGQAPNFSWGSGVDSPNASYGYGVSVAADNDGNTFVAANQENFLPGAEVYFINGDVLICENGHLGYIVKYDTQGNILWTFGAISDNGGCLVSAVAFDGQSGVFISGNAWGGNLAIGDTSIVVNSLVGYPGKPFIAHCNSDGHISWVHMLEDNPGSGIITDMASDGAGAFYATGLLGADISTFNGFIIETDTLTARAFTIKFDDQGTIQWAIPYGSRRLAVTSDGGLVLNGPALDTLTIGSDTLVNHNYLARFSAAGEPLWSQSYGLVQWGIDDFWFIENGLICDAEDNVYFGSSFPYETLSFCGENLVNPNFANNENMNFLAKFNPVGDLTWINSTVGVTDVYSLAVDASGNLLAGAKLFDPAGNMLWDIDCWGGRMFNDAVLHPSGAVSYTGIQYVPEYDCGGISFLFDGNPWAYYYVTLQVASSTVSIPNRTSNSSNEPIAFPNPMQQSASLFFNEHLTNAKLKLINGVGQIVYSDVLNGNKYQLENRNWPAGTYMAVVQTNSKIYSIKILVE